MPVRILCCDEEIISNEENQKKIFNHFNVSASETSNQAIIVPYDPYDQGVSSTLEKFAQEYDEQSGNKGKVRRIYLSGENSALEYLYKGMDAIARSYPDELIEIDVYFNSRPSSIIAYFATRTFPGTIKLAIHHTQDEKILDKTQKIQGQGLINEDRYFIRNLPVAKELELIKGMLKEYEEPFLRKSLHKLGSILLEKPNEQNKEVFADFYTSVHTILLQYKLILQNQHQPREVQQAIELVVSQALTLAASVSSKSKTAAFFSDAKYFSLDDFRATTKLMQRVVFLLDDPNPQNINKMINALKHLNNSNNAQYLVAAGLILAGALIMTAPISSLLALGFSGVIAVATPALLFAISIATMATSIAGIFIAAAGMNAVSVQTNDAEVKANLDDAITIFKSVILLENQDTQENNKSEEQSLASQK